MTNEELLLSKLGISNEYSDHSMKAILAYADEIRRECAEKFKEATANCADILPNKVECVLTGSDIERIEAAIMGKEAGE
jgi:hypothetical protein